MKFTLVTTAKNEGPYFWEWVAHHKSVGFDNIIIFQNDSDDLTHEILKTLEDVGVVRYLYNRAGRGRHQARAYHRRAKQPEYQSADWIMALDLDEFFFIRTGDATLDALLNAVPDCDQILINWKLFGCGDQIGLSDLPVTGRFYYAEEQATIATNLRAYKTLFKRDGFVHPGIHLAQGFVGQEAPGTVNGSGLNTGEFLVKNHRSTGPGLRKLAQINHYVVKDP